jgi:hypothetical protein
MEFLAEFLDTLGDLAMAISSNQPPLAKKIEAARRKQWVLLAAAPTPTSKQPDFQEQKQLLAAASLGLQERNALVIYLPHGELIPSEELYLHQHCGLLLKGFEVVLIGKADNIKLRATQVLAPESLFGAINKASIDS